jgi:hypothetical protein
MQCIQQIREPDRGVPVALQNRKALRRIVVAAVRRLRVCADVDMVGAAA